METPLGDADEGARAAVAGAGAAGVVAAGKAAADAKAQGNAVGTMAGPLQACKIATMRLCRILLNCRIMMISVQIRCCAVLTIGEQIATLRQT